MKKDRIKAVALGAMLLLGNAVAGHADVAVGVGSNQYGQLANSTNNTSTRPNPNPLRADAGSEIISVASGSDFTLVLKSDGKVWAYGNNRYGQLGNTTNNGSNTSNVVPTQVPVLNNIVAISGGVNHAMALRADGTVWTWGNNRFGQLGNTTDNGSDVAHPTPSVVVGLLDVTQISAGADHCLVLKTDGTVWGWGFNRFGQLGNATNINSSASTNPAPLQAGITNVTAISAGYYHGLLLKNDGSVWGIGWNIRGQMGNPGSAGANGANATPYQVSGISNATAVAAGYYHSLARKNDGTVWAWGLNQFGQLGNDTNAGNASASNTTALQVTGLSGATAIAAGYFHSLALTSSNRVWGWGRNEYGQLGNSTNNNNSSAVNSTATQSPNLVNITAISAGESYTSALTNGAPTVSDGSILLGSKTAPKVLTLPGSDPQGNPLTFSLVTGVSFGSLTNLTGNQVTYTPDGSGTPDSFTFRANDGSYNSNTATFTITHNAAPVLESLVPSTQDGFVIGTGSAAAYGTPLFLDLKVSDVQGASSVRMVYLTFNKALGNSGGCVLAYDAAHNLMTLRSDDGKTLLPGGTPGDLGATPVSNSFATLDFANSSVTRKAQYLDIRFAITPLQPFVGSKKLWAKVRDNWGLSSADVEMASWTVLNAPAAFNATAVGFSTVIKPGVTSLPLLLKSTNPDGVLLTYLIDSPPTHGTLTPVNGNLFSYAPGGTFAAAGTDSFNFTVTDGYTNSAPATVTIKYNSAPVLVSLTPATADGAVTGTGGSSTVGDPLDLTLVVSDVDGADQLRMVYLTFNRNLSNSNGIVLSYDVLTNKMFLRNDAGTTLLGGESPTAAVAPVENSFGSLDFANSAAVNTGDTLTVKFRVTPKAPFTGAKNLWAKVKDSGSLTDGDDLLATWTLNSAPVTLRSSSQKSSAQDF